MSRALVTGATGLVGSHIVERLVADGWSVRALVRSSRTPLPDSRVEARVGDILDEASVISAAGGCDVVFHAAAHIIVRGGWDAYRVTNVDGTRNVIAAAERARARLLHVSSVAVYGSTARYRAARHGMKTDEETPLEPLRDGAHYARSKRESEALVLRAHTEGRVWASAVRPDVIYGRRDRQFVPRIAKLVRLGIAPLLSGGRTTMPVVHAANVADGAIRAATTDSAGGRAYNLANDYDVTVRRFFELAAEGLGRRVLYVPINARVAGATLRGAKTATRWLSGGAINLISNSSISFLAEDNPYTSERARRELGWKPLVRPEDGVPDAFRWWRDQRDLK